jgi:putative DNA primase/helicase
VNGKIATDLRPRDRAREIPDDVRKRFAQVGNEFFFPDGTRAFTDRGGRITSPSENTEVIKSLVAIAEARGWTDVTVRGTERFRKEAWYAARQAGLQVSGFRPSAYDEAKVARTLTRGGDQRMPEVEPRPPDGEADSDRRSRIGRTLGTSRRGLKGGSNGLHVGKLAYHGAAPYRHDEKHGMSYFVRLETADGEREIWGVDLQRALNESLTRPKIGDEVGLRAVRRDAVTFQTPTRDKDGHIVGSERLTTHRNRWILEQHGFFKERAQAARIVRNASVDPKDAVKGNPELAGTYLKIHASELAANAIRDPEDRRRFVATVRRTLADEVARGEALTPVRLKEPPRRQREPRARQPDQAPAR